MLNHNNHPFYTKLSNNQRSLFSVICYSESIHTYSFIWIVWHWNAFLVFVCLHISSYSSIQSIQIIIQLMTFPESIDKMLSLIHDNSRIMNNMIIIMGCFFPFLLQNSLMNVSVTLFIIICFEIYMIHFQLLFILLLFPFHSC